MKIPLLIISGIALFLIVAFGLVALMSGRSPLTDGVLLVAIVTGTISLGIRSWIPDGGAESQ